MSDIPTTITVDQVEIRQLSKSSYQVVLNTDTAGLQYELGFIVDLTPIRGYRAFTSNGKMFPIYPSLAFAIRTIVDWARAHPHCGRQFHPKNDI